MIQVIQVGVGLRVGRIGRGRGRGRGDFAEGLMK